MLACMNVKIMHCVQIVRHMVPYESYSYMFACVHKIEHEYQNIIKNNLLVVYYYKYKEKFVILQAIGII